MPTEAERDPLVEVENERDPLAEEIWRRLNLVGLLANGLGGVIVTLFLTFLFPTTVSAAERDRLIGPSLVVFAVYMPLSLYLGNRLATRKGRQIMDWLESGEVASDEVRAAG